MHSPDAMLPPTASLRIIILIFVVSVALFHAVLILWKKLDKIGWKYVEYGALLSLALTLFAHVSQLRTKSASSLSETLRQRSAVNFGLTKDTVDFYASKPGPVCVTFVRSEFSPPQAQFEQIQREYDAACDWMGQFAQRLKTEGSWLDRREPVTLNLPEMNDVVLHQMFGSLEQEIGDFDRNVADLKAIEGASRESEFEEFVGYMEPGILVIVLALGVTRVTGGLLIEIEEAKKKGRNCAG